MALTNVIDELAVQSESRALIHDSNSRDSFILLFLKAPHTRDHGQILILSKRFDQHI